MASNSILQIPVSAATLATEPSPGTGWPNGRVMSVIARHGLIAQMRGSIIAFGHGQTERSNDLVVEFEHAIEQREGDFENTLELYEYLVNEPRWIVQRIIVRTRDIDRAEWVLISIITHRD
jgi:hypothetical protein